MLSSDVQLIVASRISLAVNASLSNEAHFNEPTEKGRFRYEEHEHNY